MSLKQRAMQCSAHIPASQYVPVYSRPHRTNGRWHEELSPITPKPDFDDPYNSRTQSIHDAVKQWLDSSPKSVIGPLYRSRSPSSDSPPSHGSSIEHSAAIASGARMDSNNNRAHDDGKAVLASMQEIEGESGEHRLVNNDGENKGSDAVPRTDRQKSCAKEAESSPPTEEATNYSDVRERGGKKRSLKDFKRLDQKQLSETTSESSIRDSSSRLSRDFDAVLAAAVIASEASEEVNPFETPSTPALGGPQIHLKPPRGLEKVVLHEGEQKSADTETLHQPTLTTNEANGFVVGGARANRAENFSAEVPKTEEERFGEGAIADQAKDLPAAAPVIDQRKFGNGASLQKTDELRAVGSKRRSGTSSLGIKSGRRNESVASAESTRFLAGDLPGISSNRAPSSHRAASIASSYDSRTESARRRVQPWYHSGGSAANSANHVFPQHMYELSSPQTYGAKVHRSTRKTITPEESQKRRNAKSNTKQVSPTKAALEKASWNKQQARVAAWEEAKNASFLNRYKKEESQIRAWEAQKIAKASMALSKLEVDLEKRRVKATEKMQYEVAMAHKKAQEMTANAESKRAERAAKAAVQAQILRVLGKSPLSCFCS